MMVGCCRSAMRNAEMRLRIDSGHAFSFLFRMCTPMDKKYQNHAGDVFKLTAMQAVEPLLLDVGFRIALAGEQGQRCVGGVWEMLESMAGKGCYQVCEGARKGHRPS